MGPALRRSAHPYDRNQLSFPIALHGLDLPDAAGYIVGDIGSTLDVKLQAIRCYETQFPASKAGLFKAVEAMNRYQGLTAGFEAGELFMTHRSVGLDDVMRWASPAHARPLNRRKDKELSTESGIVVLPGRPSGRVITRRLSR